MRLMLIGGGGGGSGWYWWWLLWLLFMMLSVMMMVVVMVSVVIGDDDNLLLLITGQPRHNNHLMRHIFQTQITFKLKDISRFQIIKKKKRKSPEQQSIEAKIFLK